MYNYIYYMALYVLLNEHAYYQTTHLSWGFIVDPGGQRNASAKATEFIIIPLTLEILLIIILSM